MSKVSIAAVVGTLSLCGFSSCMAYEDSTLPILMVESRNPLTLSVGEQGK